MAALSDEARELVHGCFEMKAFSEMFPIIGQYYKKYELGEDMTDDEKIAEYQYVNEQLRKFAFKNQDAILDYGSDLEGMLGEAKAMLERGGEYAGTRKQLMYNFMRDAWLIELCNIVSWIIDNANEEEEEDE